jgi:hypothetical protein
MINNFVQMNVCTPLTYFGLLETKMTNFNLQSANEHMVATASTRLCADRSYMVWPNGGKKFNNEQDPITMASFYKESGN